MELLFDLDGTLVDSAAGIRKSLQKGLEMLGVDSPGDGALDAMIGLTFGEIWPRLTGFEDPARHEQATLAFRDHYDSGAWREVSWIPGMEKLVRRLHDDGLALGVATMKPSAAAKRVLEHLGGHDWFGLFLGAADEGEMITRGKTGMLEQAIKEGRLRRPGMLVGDRAEDIRAARATGLLSVAVLWGMGSREELAAEKPDYICENVDELFPLITSLVHD